MADPASVWNRRKTGCEHPQRAFLKPGSVQHAFNFCRAPTSSPVQWAAWRPQASGRGCAPLPVASVTREGISDLTLNGRKISGNAQQRKRRHFLHHGTLLCGMDLELVSRYLRSPEREPTYRGHRSHGDFVANLPADVPTVRALLVNEWHPHGQHGELPWERVQTLVAEKYGTAEWTRRR